MSRYLDIRREILERILQGVWPQGTLQPWDIYDGLEDAQALEAKLKAGMAFSVFHAFFAVAANNELEMLRREEQLREKLQGVIRLVHPPGDALTVWQAFFPGETGGVDRSWAIPADPSIWRCNWNISPYFEKIVMYDRWFGQRRGKLTVTVAYRVRVETTEGITWVPIEYIEL